MSGLRRYPWIFASVVATIFVLYFWQTDISRYSGPHSFGNRPEEPGKETGTTDDTGGPALQVDAQVPSISEDEANGFSWSQVEQHYPLTEFAPLPTADARRLPKIQHEFASESANARSVRESRRDAVLGNFTRSWRGYKAHAWLKDEVGPLSGNSYDHFGGWAATLVDTLDTLWIMGLTTEFNEAIEAISSIDFSNCQLEEINVFETVIRYMGGLLGAFDLTEGKHPILLTKATELGEMVYKAFDTPNRMPITRWKFMDARNGVKQIAPEGALVAEIGSLALELTRLSQLLKDDKYYDAVKRITDTFVSQQNETLLPGMFPLVVNPRDRDFKSGSLFTLGGMVDSLYEYLPKVHLLMHGATDDFRKLYESAMGPIQKHIVYTPLTTDGRDIRIAGQVNVDEKVDFEPQSQHLTCFMGGMVGLGSRAFGHPDQMRLARQLTDGCTWGYEIMPRGIMPEIMHLAYCQSEACSWDEDMWHTAVDQRTHIEGTSITDRIKELHLPQGVTQVDDARYGLRPEAIESAFLLYRLTGDTTLQDTAWEMFNSIIVATETELGAAALSDCVDPDEDHKTDRMESFWLAETLKYFYLIFSEPSLVSLDEFVLNTEAHPFRYRYSS